MRYKTDKILIAHGQTQGSDYVDSRTKLVSNPLASGFREKGGDRPKEQSFKDVSKDSLVI